MASELWPDKILIGTSHSDRYTVPRSDPRAVKQGAQWICHHPCLCRLPRPKGRFGIAALRAKIGLKSSFCEDTELMVRVATAFGPERIVALKYLAVKTNDMGAAAARHTFLPLLFVSVAYSGSHAFAAILACRAACRATPACIAAPRSRGARR